MTRHVACDAEHFAIGMEELLADIEPGVARELSKAIPKAGRKGAKLLKKAAEDKWGEGKTGARYAAGFSSTKIQAGLVTTCEIGNRNAPGLVHLLEKGHATLTGRRARAYPHVAPVYEEIEPEVLEAVEKAVGRVLEG